MRSIATIALSVLLSLAVASTAFADVQFSLRNGRVTIIARNATVAEILAEWAKVGHTTITNAEKLSHDRVTLELTNLYEQQALDVLLRAASGYTAALREVPVENASQFARIAVTPYSMAPRTNDMAASAANGSASAGYQVASQRPATYQAPADPQQPDVSEPQRADDSAKETNDANDDQPFVTMAGAVAPPSPSVQKTFATRRAVETIDPRDVKLPPNFGAVGGPPARGASPFGGVAAPGMIVQPPMQPRQPGAPGQPPVVRQ
jgi:hypothetical protein